MTRQVPNLCRRRAWRSGALLPAAALLLGFAPRGIAAQEHLPEHSRAELRGEIARAEGVVRACAGSAAACDASAAPPNESIAAEGEQPKFTLRWDWLAEALDAAKKAEPAKTKQDQAERAGERQAAMQASFAHLEAIARDAGLSAPAAPPAEPTSFPAARHAADTVLARVEFDKVAPPSWWDRLLAKVWGAVALLFDGMGRLGAHRPWIGKALELLLFLAAGVTVLLFVRRNFQRQRLTASLRGEQAVRSVWDHDATDWATRAESAAAQGEWRDAVHCLYWAAIMRLESRRAWRHNPARTPREYVRLLKPGSVQRESLGGLTGLLERVWYGLRPAGAEDYSHARTWFERLSEAGGGMAAGAGGGYAAGASAPESGPA